MKRFICVLAVAAMAVGTTVFADMQSCERELMAARGAKPMVRPVAPSQIDLDSALPRKYDVTRLLHQKRYLGLTGDQVKQLEEIRDDLKTPASENRAALRALFGEIEQLENATSPDFMTIKEKVEKMHDLHLEMSTAAIESMEKAFDILSPEQRQKLTAATPGKRR